MTLLMRLVFAKLVLVVSTEEVRSLPCSSTRYKNPLGLVHSDVCGKMSAESLRGAEYFPTFIDDNTHYVWVYPLNTKMKCLIGF